MDRATRWTLVTLLCTLTAAAASADDWTLCKSLVEELPRAGRLMVRPVSSLRYQMDFYAYHANPIFHYPLEEPPKAPANTPTLADLDFDGALAADTITDEFDPKSLGEFQRVAWAPLMKRLSEWNWDAALPLLEAEAKITEEKWGNEELINPLQSIALAYVYDDAVWAMVEFRPEMDWVPAKDSGALGEDGYPEVYARLNVELTPALRDELAAYTSEKLDAEGLEQYFYELASDWYQGYQTITLEPEDSRPWPNDDTEPKIVALLDGKHFATPFAVVRGKPYGETIYNVFIAPSGDERVEQAGTVTVEPDPYASEVAKWGGSYAAWADKLAGFRADVQAKLDARPEELQGLIGEDGFLFYRGDLEYLLSGDLREQDNNPYPVIVDFAQQLKARGIDLLMVFIPTKAEVFPENVAPSAPDGAQPYVAPYGRKLQADLAAAGVSCVDLLPEFIRQRDAGGEPLYMRTDSHWTPRGAELAAHLIAERAMQYPWYAQVAANKVAYTSQDAEFTRRGDICDMLAAGEKLKYRPETLTAHQVVNPDGSLYEDDPDGPIVMLGDSFCGVFHYEDCEHAGVSAQVARELGVPFDLISAQGSGPRIRGQFARRGPDGINAKKLVIWTCVTRDLYNYWAPWDIIKLPE